MRFSAYETTVRREIDAWQRDRTSPVQQAIEWLMQPVDRFVERSVSPDLIDRASEKLSDTLSHLSDASTWTYEAEAMVHAARRRGLAVERAEDLRSQPLEVLDPMAREHFTENTILAAVEGGGTGLGGAALILADIPLLFTINFRLIQQISAVYGFPMREPKYRPLVVSIFNVAASGSAEAKSQALREISVAAAAFANELDYKGRVSNTWRDQNRHLPREIAKNLVGRKLAQTIPIAGAAVGAGINYWFTSEAANTTYMLMRALYLEHKERR